MIVDLPWPNRLLHPNARVHWARKAKAAKVARHAAYFLALNAGVHPKMRAAKAAQVTLTFFPPDNRHRDLDGMLGSCKAALDGISDAIGINDSRWAIVVYRAAAERLGRVQVKIEELAV